MMWRYMVAVLCLLLAAAEIRGQDFDLGDAFDEPTVETTPKKPVAPSKASPADDVETTPKKPVAPSKASPADVETTPKKPVAPSKASPADDFNLKDATDLEPSKPSNKPAPRPQPVNPGGGGAISDSDLFDGDLPNDPQSGGEHKPNRASDGDQEAGGGQPNMIAGIVSGVAVAAVGAVSSFIAYQKKKLCFKGASEDPENVNMENQKDPADPQVQSSLLPK